MADLTLDNQILREAADGHNGWSLSGFLDHLEQEADDYIASENRWLVLQDEKVIRVLVAKVIERVKWLQSPD